MAIPIAYNLRNLVVRKTTTIMTALGIALTVAVLLAVLALAGLRYPSWSLPVVVIGTRQRRFSRHRYRVSGCRHLSNESREHARAAADEKGSSHEIGSASC